jgi:hypothetical protein
MADRDQRAVHEDSVIGAEEEITDRQAGAKGPGADANGPDIGATGRATAVDAPMPEPHHAREPPARKRWHAIANG